MSEYSHDLLAYEELLLTAQPTPQVAELLADGLDLHARNDLSETFLMRIVRKTSNAAVVAALLEAGADVNARTRNGYTPLMYSAWLNEFPEVTKTLLRYEADLHARSSHTFGSTNAFLMACKRNPNPAVHPLLIQAGAEINPPASQGLEGTPLALAIAGNKNVEVPLLLLQAGAAPNDSSQNDSMLALAIASDHDARSAARLINALLAAGADVNGVSSSDTRPLLVQAIDEFSVRCQSIPDYGTEVIQALLKANAPIGSPQGLTSNDLLPGTSSQQKTSAMLTDDEINALLR